MFLRIRDISTRFDSGTIFCFFVDHFRGFLGLLDLHSFANLEKLRVNPERSIVAQ